MKEKLVRILSFLFLLAGFFLILNSSVRNITGNIIRENLSAGGSILGLALIIGGIVLLLAKREERLGNLEEKLKNTDDIKTKIKLIEAAHVNKVLDEVTTANMINEIFNNQMNSIIYKYQTVFTIGDENNKYSLIRSKTDTDLAYAIRNRIIANNPGYEKNCQLHISKTESTKDHRKGLRK